MHAAVFGAGQIGSALVPLLISAGHSVTIVRRRAWTEEGAARLSPAGQGDGLTLLTGDAGDPALLRRALDGVDAVFHLIHAAYSTEVWRRELPPRERAVMDAAAEREIPVVFPESVYAWGHQAEDLHEGRPVSPCSPLGQVRAEMLAARREHPARTLSVVASDFIGPTAAATSVQALVLDRAAAGRRGVVFGDPDQLHSLTRLPDLAAALLRCAEHAEDLAPSGDAVLHAPTPPARSLRTEAHEAATTAGVPLRGMLAVPGPLLRGAGRFSATARELQRQRYLWTRPCVLRPGVLGQAPIS